MFITDFPLFSLMCLHYKEIGLLNEFLTDGKQVIEDVDFYTASLVKADYYNWKNHIYLHNNYTSYAIEILFDKVFDNKKFNYITRSSLYRKLLKAIKNEINELKDNYTTYFESSKRVYVDKDLYDPEESRIGTIKEYVGTSYIFKNEFEDFILSELTDTNLKVFNMELKLSNKSLADRINE